MGVCISLWIILWLWSLSSFILRPRKLSYERQLKREVRRGKFNNEEYQKADKYRFNLQSDFGYILSCELIEPDHVKSNKLASNQMESNQMISNKIEAFQTETDNPDMDIGKKEKKYKNIAVLCHGLGCSRCVSYKYAEIFLRLGFTVLLYDHRNHGQSGKAYTSMGYYERLDLKKVIDWCFEHYGENIRIVTHGESMGAATVLMHLGIDNRVTCAIADCSYSDLNLLLQHQVKTFYHLPFFLIPVVSFITYLRAGFWYRDISPIDVVRKSDVPVLFIHGKIDNFVPADMSKWMYASKRKNKALYLVARAKHAESVSVN
ncbi:MAG: alpha/beta hydrolase [Clostridiales bacterium]|nr:alpha/beta hydrolase [Clostridiales bacterium]